MLQWTNDLSVGVDLIDHQHKELFRRTNQLLEAMRQGKGSEEVSNVMGFLGSYIVKHFSDEERLMVVEGYPGYLSHRKLHQDFVNKFEILKKNFETKGSSTSFIIELQSSVIDWLRNHISKIDKQVGNHVLSQKQVAV